MNTGRHSSLRDHSGVQLPKGLQCVTHRYFLFLILMGLLIILFFRYPFLQSFNFFFFLLGLWLISQAICPSLCVHIGTPYPWNFFSIQSKWSGIPSKALYIERIFLTDVFQDHPWMGLWCSSSLLLAGTHILSWLTSEPGMTFVLFAR